MIARYGTGGARGASARGASRVTRAEDVDPETCQALLRFSLAVVRVETTVRTTYEREAGARRRAVVFKADREIDSPDTWMFTDGGSKGWQSLVVLRPGQDPRLVARAARTETRNVGAEVAAVVSALEAVLPEERAVIVSDFLWSIYYVLGWYRVENALLREQVEAARALLAERRPPSVRFIHVKGHERDDSPLGRWNDIADRLCALGVAVDERVPAAAFDPSRRRRKLSELLAVGPFPHRRSSKT
jgi:RNase H-like protein